MPLIRPVAGNEARGQALPSCLEINAGVNFAADNTDSTLTSAGEIGCGKCLRHSSPLQLRIKSQAWRWDWRRYFSAGNN